VAYISRVPGAAVVDVGVASEDEAVLVTLSVRQHDVLELFHDRLRRARHEVQRTVIVRLYIVVLLRKPAAVKRWGLYACAA